MTPNVERDALSDVLRALRLSGGMFFRVALRPPYGVWSMEHEALCERYGAGADHVLPFHVVTSGRIWFESVGHEPVAVDEGDVIVFPRGTAHALVDRPGRPPVPVARLDHKVRGHPPTLHHGGEEGHEARALCGFFRSQGRLFNPLLDALPERMVIRRDPTRTPWIQSTLERAFLEDLEGGPGNAALVERLVELLFVEVVQAHVRQEPGGWLGGLTDPAVGRALALLHAAPAHPWTVAELARRVGLSRSALADRFRSRVGRSLIRYLTAWRMELAAQLLAGSERSVAEVADQVGYRSEAALNRAFKRHVGQPPAAWRRAQAERLA